jgi:outer membrane protein OmpA-like peptidoglycan-associated protein
MTKNKKESFFWTSYSDLMTSLFFVMLVLFVLTIVLLHNKIMEIDAERKATQEQLDKIKEVEDAVKNIDSRYFQYDADYKRHTLVNIDVSFERGSSDIYDIPEYQRNKLVEAGNSITNFVRDAVKSNDNVKYLLILEGQSSKDSYTRNYELSYERALALYKYWAIQQVDFDSHVCEVIISGSGHSSPFRQQPDIDGNKANQRFVIHIIPKIGEIK